MPSLKSNRFLALDIGEKRIGIALSDPQGIIAQPLTYLQRRGEKEDIEAILSLVSKYQAKLIIVGLPRSLDGSLGKEAQRVQTFIHSLEEAGVHILAWDERLSTVEAERRLKEVGVRDKGKRDALAAAFVLQSFLEYRRRQ